MSRALPLLKVLVVVLVAGVLVVAAALARHLVFGGGNDTPRTELERAVFAAEEAVKASPNDPAARVKLAAAYLEQGSTRLAITQAETAIRLAPEDPTGLYVLGLAQSKAGKPKEAVATLTKTVNTKGQIAQFYQDAYVALARAQERDGDLKAAAASLGKALDNGPENALVYFERGRLYEKMKNYTYALLDYRWAMDYVPNYGPALEAFNRLQKEHPADFKKAEKIFDSDAAAGAAPKTNR